ncbi:MAG: CBS domain-containing protein [Candidatus Lokiarchaeota archaeon]|nr:CBS domain-containing protein [Candidatus Lokiarchaeota archaeon]
MKIPQSTISRIENNDMDPPYSKVKKIFEFLEQERIKKNNIYKTAKEIMTKQIISISSHSSIKDTIELMNKHDLSQVPIIDADQNLGSLTAKKIQKFIADHPDLKNVNVLDLKQLPFPEIEKDWSIKAISNLLSNYPAILVKEYNRFVGIITDADFLKLV